MYDITLLKYQSLFSINCFFKLSDISNIYIIYNNVDYDYLKDLNSLYPKLPIKLINEDSIAIKNCNSWYYQQILKILISRIIKDEWYLIIDCDSYLIKKIEFKDLIINNKAITNFRQSNFFWLKYSNKLLKINKKPFSSLGIIPIIFKTDIVLDMIKYIENIYDKSIEDILNKNKFTETILYHLYITEIRKEKITDYYIDKKLYGNCIYQLNTLHDYNFKSKSFKEIISNIYEKQFNCYKEDCYFCIFQSTFYLNYKFRCRVYQELLLSKKICDSTNIIYDYDENKINNEHKEIIKYNNLNLKFKKNKIKAIVFQIKNWWGNEITSKKRVSSLF